MATWLTRNGTHIIGRPMLRSRLRVEKTLGLIGHCLTRSATFFLYKNGLVCQKDFDRHEKRLGIVNALLDPLVFRIKQHIIVC